MGKSTDIHHFFLLLQEALHFMDHLIQAFLNYAPDKVCMGLRGFLGHGTLNAKPRKGSGKLGQLVAQAPEKQQEMGEWSPVPNPNSGPHQQPQLLYLYLFYIVGFAYTSI